MKIRQAQLDVLAEASRRDFVRRTVAFLQANFADAAALTTEVLTPTTEQQVAAAARYGFETERDLASYVTAAWILGAEFDRERFVVQEVLENRSLQLAEKARRLVRLAREEMNRRRLD